MTGPEHYRAAERILAGVKTPDGAIVVDPGTAEVIAAAQVHATLALAAATVDRSGVEFDSDAWSEVTS